MYFSILKRDLKRKKTMNTILLIFMILSVMFVSSSVNTMLSVSSAVEKFLDVSGAKDYYVATIGTAAGETAKKNLESLDSVRSISSETIFYLNENSVEHDGNILNISSNGVLNNVDDLCIRLYDQDKQELTHIDDGDIYVKSSFMEKNHLSMGDRIGIRIAGCTREFTVRGTVLDVLFGSDMSGTPRFLISKHDFDQYSQNCTGPIAEMSKGMLLNIEADDIKAVETVVNDIDGVAFTGSRDVIKLTYILDMIIAGVFLIVSICLIIISLVLLKFTIGFTISEEYREIGVMKAIGIKNGRIRTLYMVKYLAMALTGAVIGFAAGIPFGRMMMAQSTKKLITGDNESILVNLLCAAAVVLIIVLFCRLSTGKVKKFTPVDAIRSGESGRRYKKKGLLKLSKSHTAPVFFMAVNDILSGFRHYAVMTLTFIVGILMITIILNTISTLQSPKLLAWFSMADCDVTLEDKGSAEKYTRADGQERREAYLEEMEKTLAQHDIPAECFGETVFKMSIRNGAVKTISLAFIGSGTTTDQYSYLEGTPPEDPEEVALSCVTADKLGVTIGDKVTIRTGGENEEFMVTALYQSMNNLGEGIRFSEKLTIDFSKALGYFSYQVRYTDTPSDSEVGERFEKIRELYPKYTIRTAGEYVDYSIGGVAGALSETKLFIVLMVMMINTLVVVLMEKSFLTKERGEIALLKAIGFRNRTLIAWQTIRVGLLMIAAVLISVLLTEPVSQLAVGGIFRMMGAKNIIFDINILDTFVIYPLAVLAVTVLAVLLSALGIRHISSQEVNNIE